MTMKLYPDIQYDEGFTSHALNRKFSGIVSPGIYQGYNWALPGGMKVRIGHASLVGICAVETGEQNITVRSTGQTDITIPPGAKTAVVVSVDYQVLQPTVADIVAVPSDSVLPRHIILVEFDVPAGATELTQAMADDSRRIHARSLSESDSDERYAPREHSHPYRPDTWLPSLAEIGAAPAHGHPYRPDTWVPSWTQVTGKPATATRWPTLAEIGAAPAHGHPYRPDNWVPTWTQVTGKPLKFTPEEHSHLISHISDFYGIGRNIDTYDQGRFWGTYVSSSTDQGTKAANYCYYVNLGGSGQGHGLQLATAYSTSNKLYFRGRSDNASAENGANKWKNWRELYHTDHHPVADKWTTARTLTLTGGATGSVSIDGSGNMSLSVTIPSDGHNHDTRYYTQAQSNERYLGKTAKAADAEKVDGYSAEQLFRRMDNTTDYKASANHMSLQQFGGTLPAGLSGAYNYGNLLTFNDSSARLRMYAPHHEGSKSALYFSTGWDSDVKAWEKVMTWSAGDGRYLGKTAQAADSAKLGGSSKSVGASANTIAQRDSSGDITVRLCRSTYGNETRMTGAVAFRVNTSDNYTRWCSSPSAFRGWLGVLDTAGYDGRYLGKSGTAAKTKVNTSSSSSYYNMLWHSGDTIYGANGKGPRYRPSDGHTVFEGNVRVDGPANSHAYLDVMAADTSISWIRALGSSQGTGGVYVGQSSSYGGGIMYNGDDNPNVPQTQDAISFFRRENGVDHEVIRYAHSSDTVHFTGGAYFGSNIHLAANKTLYFDGGTTLKLQDARGNYGTVAVHGERSGWAGFSVQDRFVMMHDGADAMGLFNDVDNHWIMLHNRNGSTSLYYDANKKIETVSGGANVTGTMTASSAVQAPTLRVSDDTDTYLNKYGVYDDGKRCYSENFPPPAATGWFYHIGSVHSSFFTGSTLNEYYSPDVGANDAWRLMGFTVNYFPWSSGLNKLPSSWATFESTSGGTPLATVARYNNRLRVNRVNANAGIVHCRLGIRIGMYDGYNPIRVAVTSSSTAGSGTVFARDQEAASRYGDSYLYLDFALDLRNATYKDLYVHVAADHLNSYVNGMNMTITPA